MMTFTNKVLRKKLVGPTLRINTHNIAYTPTYKYLGTLDPLLKFSHHAATVKHNIRHKVYLFNRIKYNLPESPAVKVIKTMIIPIIDYCDVFYDVATKQS